jgi:hypothetical protein
MLPDQVHGQRIRNTYKDREGREREAIFYVKHSDSERELVCPFTRIPFVAPQFEKPKMEDVDLSHHCDRVAVQCPGVLPTAANSSGTENCMSSADCTPLDDGYDHKVRIILERNRYYTKPVKSTGMETGMEANPTHRLMVYVDDMRSALINLEIDLENVFGDGAEPMFAGFTGGTGRLNASHVIKSWKFYEVTGLKKPAEKGGVFSWLKLGS